MLGPESYTPWGTRFAARLLDALFLTALFVASAAAAAGIGWLIDKNGGLVAALFGVYVADLLTAIIYYLVGAASGQTIGKKAMKYHTARLDGTPLGFWRALAKEFLNILSTLPLMIGWLAPLWSPRRQTWHDAMAGSVSLPGPSPKGARPAVIAVLIMTLITIGAGAGSAAAFGDYFDTSDDYYAYDPYADESYSDSGSAYCSSDAMGREASSNSSSGSQVISVTMTNTCDAGLVITDPAVTFSYSSADGSCSGVGNFSFADTPVEIAPYSSVTVDFYFDTQACSGSLNWDWNLAWSASDSVTSDSGPSEVYSGY